MSLATALALMPLSLQPVPGQIHLSLAAADFLAPLRAVGSALRAAPRLLGEGFGDLRGIVGETGTVLADAATTFLDASGGDVQATCSSAPFGAREIPAARTRYSRTYDMGDGTHQAVFCSKPVNYRDSAGDWRPIDDTLVPASDPTFAYQNRANGYTAFLPPKISAPVKFQVGSYWISFSLDHAQGNGQGSAVTDAFPNALNGANVAYTPGSDGLKENISLSGPFSPSTFLFHVVTGPGLNARTDPSGGIDFVDDSGTAQISFPPPFMYDSSGTDDGMSSAVSYSLTPTASGADVTLTADRSWLQDPARQYPVVIDPTTDPPWYPSPDCHIANSPYQDNTFCANTQLKVGVGSGGTIRRILMKFPGVSSIPPNADITDSQLSLYMSELGSTSKAHYIEVHRLKEGQQFTTGVTWRKYNGTDLWTTAGGNLDPNVEDNLNIAGTGIGWKQWAPTALVREWVNGTYLNRGLMLKADDEINNPNLLTFVSSEDTSSPDHRPNLVVTYDTPPDTPTNLSPSSGSVVTSGPTLSGTFSDPDPWTDQGYLTFEIHKSSDGSLVTSFSGCGNVPNQKVSSGESCSWDVSPGTLAPGVSYYWRAKAVETSGKSSGWTANQTITPDATVYLRPISVLHANGAELSWSAFAGSSSTFDAYSVFRKEGSNSFSTSGMNPLTVIGDADTTSFQDTTATPGHTYTYEVGVVGTTSNPQTATLPTDGQSQLVLQPVGPNGLDAYLHYESGHTLCDNTGADPELQIGSDDKDIYRPVLRFDLRDIPPGSTVTSATLSLWNDTAPSSSATVEVHALRRAWTAGSGNASCTGDGANWYTSDGGVSWTTPGGDFDPSIIASMSKSGGGSPGWDDFNVASQVQEWTGLTPQTNLGSSPPAYLQNFGFLLKTATEPAASGHSFPYASSDYANSTRAPKLVVTYRDGTHPTSPTLALVTPADGSTVSGTTPITYSASDDHAVAQVKIVVDGQVKATLTQPPYTYSWDAHLLSGTHTIHAVATDDVGNTTTSQDATVTVDNSQAPSITITSPGTNATVSGTTTVTAHPSGPVAHVDFYADGTQFLGRVNSPPDGNGNYNLSWVTLDQNDPVYDGTHVLTAVAVLANGRTAITQPGVQVTVANTSSTHQACIAGSPPQTLYYDPTQQTPVTVPIHVRNLSNQSWGNGYRLSYRWYADGAPTLDKSDISPLVSDSTNANDPYVAAPSGGNSFLCATTGQTDTGGADYIASLDISPPALTDGVNSETYRLQIDLKTGNGNGDKWFADEGNKPLEALVNIHRVIPAAHDDTLGLERYYQYQGEDVGAGMTSLVNAGTGNSILHWEPFNDPGRGLATIADLTYNSLDDTKDLPAGNNWTLSISSLVPFGEHLLTNPPPAPTEIGLIDADGTAHVFTQNQQNSEVYDAPAGVHLYLRQYATSSSSDRYWAVTRPDRVTFFFNHDGWPTYVRDRNGNELSFTLTPASGCQDPGMPTEQITKVTDAAGRAMTISYYNDQTCSATAQTIPAHVRGRVKDITDHAGHVLHFDYYDDGNLLRLTELGGARAAGYSPVPDRSFVFTYTTSDGSGPATTNLQNPDPHTPNESTKLYSVTDPRGNATTFAYITSGQDKWMLASRTGRRADPSSNKPLPQTTFAYSAGPPKETTVTLPPPDTSNPTSGQRVTNYDFTDSNDPNLVTQITQIASSGNRVTTLAWNSDKEVTTLTEPGGGCTIYDYDQNGYPTRIAVLRSGTCANGTFARTLLTYTHPAADGSDPTGQKDTVGRISQLATKTDPNGVDSNWNPSGFTWFFTYDSSGNLTKVEDPEQHAAGKSTQYAYNGNGTLSTITDANNGLTTYSYALPGGGTEPDGLPTSVTDPLNRVTKFSYTDDGLLASVQAPIDASLSGGDTSLYQTQFSYDPFNRLYRQSTPKSYQYARNVLVWSSMDYDPNDNVVSTVAPHYGYPSDPVAGDTTTTTYDGMDRPTLVSTPVSTDSNGQPVLGKTSYSYDDAGRLTSVTEPEGVKTTGIANDFTTSYIYDQLDQLGVQTQYRQDLQGGTEALNTVYCYTAAGDVQWVVSPRAGASGTSVCSQQSAPNYTHQYTYFADHKLKTETDGDGHVRSYDYDLTGNLTTVSDENVNAGLVPNSEHLTYDGRNLLVEDQQPLDSSDPNHHYATTAYQYDPVGNLTLLISPRAWDTAALSGSPTPSSFTTSSKYVTGYNYDADNELTTITLPNSKPANPADDPQTYIYRTYDDNGNMTSTSLPTTSTSSPGPNRSRTDLTYFDPGWIRSSNDGVNPRVLYDYSAQGWQASRIPVGSLGLRAHWSYDPNGLLQSVSDQGGETSSYLYDLNGNLTDAVEGRGITDTQPVVDLKVSYDWLDRQLQVRERRRGDASDPNWHLTNYTYDDNGNLATREDDAQIKPDLTTLPGRLNEFTYDGADWLATQLYHGATQDTASGGCADNQKIVDTFTPTGWESQRDVSKGSSGSAPCSYSLEQRTSWQYYDNGKLKTLDTADTPDGNVNTLVSREHHDVSYLDGASPGVYVNGNRVKDTFTRTPPQGSTGTYCGTSSCSLTYTYDARDRLSQEVDNLVSKTTTTAYSLDPAGNITSKTVGGTTTTNTYQGNQLQTSTTSGITTKYFYDPNGNLDCTTTGSGTQADCNESQSQSPRLIQNYHYDYLNRLEATDSTSQAPQGVSTATYTYDALNRVVEEKETHGSANPTTRTTDSTFLGTSNLVVTDAITGTQPGTKTYTYDAYGHRISLDDTTQGAGHLLYGYDVHGSASMLVDQNGGQNAATVKATYGYDAYGNANTDLTKNDKNPSDFSGNTSAYPLNSFRYSAKRLDTGSGTYDMGVRRFGPDTDRFLQFDEFQGALDDLSLTTDPLTANRYALAGGNPLSSIEWDGHMLAPDGGGGASTDPSPSPGGAVGGFPGSSLGFKLQAVDAGESQTVGNEASGSPPVLQAIATHHSNPLRFLHPTYWWRAGSDFLTGHDVGDYGDYIAEVSREAGVDPRMVFSIIDIESHGRQLGGIFSKGMEAAQVFAEATHLRSGNSIGLGEMQQEAYNETVARHRSELGPGTWAELVIRNHYAIKVTAFRLADLFNSTPSVGVVDQRGDVIVREELAAFGYNAGEPKMKALIHGDIGHPDLSYVHSFDAAFEKANDFYCHSGDYRCVSGP